MYNDNNNDFDKKMAIVLSYTQSISVVVKKVGQSCIKQKSNFHYFTTCWCKILHG